MKRYRLTKSGVCDCMLPDDNGPWVKYEDAEQAHREGWEQGKREAMEIADDKYTSYGIHGWDDGVRAGEAIARDIATMEYKELTDES